MGFAHLSVDAVSDRPPDLMFTRLRAAAQGAGHALGGGSDDLASEMSNL
jgi:hypothetical protein